MSVKLIYTENLREMACCGESHSEPLTAKALLDAVKNSDDATKQQLKEALDIKEKEYEDVFSIGDGKVFPIEK